MERIDTIITTISNTATKKVEGMKRNILYSHEKEVRRSELLYWKMMLRKQTGKIINNIIMNQRKSITSIINEKELDVEMINNKI